MSQPVFLITGGSGTFGNAMTARLLAKHQDCQIRILSRDEVKQGDMRARFHDSPRLRFLLGDVRDQRRLFEAMRGVDTVFHAAALKRVEACAYDPDEAIRTNVMGSMNVAHAAIEAGVSRVVALSSDKACAPSTTYGATKLCMEAVFTSSTANAERRPIFSVLRYGNVMGSRGSVVEHWRALIKAGRPVPITNRGATRFWFTVDAAVDLALWAAEWATGGELIVPRLAAFSVGDLAMAMEAPGTLEMEARPNEKLHEAMVSVDEAPAFRFVYGTKAGDVYVRFLRGQEQGSAMPSHFAYSSSTAPRLTVEELRARLHEHRYDDVGKCVECKACSMCGSKACDLRFHGDCTGDD